MKLALDKVYDFILNNFESAILYMETAYGITIKRWKELTKYPTAGLQFPLIELTPLDTKPDYSLPERPFDEGWNYEYILFNVAMVGNDKIKVQDDLLWYQEALNWLVRNNSTFGDQFNRIRLGDAEYDRMREASQLEGNKRSLIKIMSQIIEARELR